MKDFQTTLKQFWKKSPLCPTCKTELIRSPFGYNKEWYCAACKMYGGK